MVYHEFLLASPYSYSAVAGLLAGIGVGGLIPGGRFRHRGARRRTAALARLYFFLSFALATAVAGLFVIGAARFAELGLVYTAISFLLAAAAAVRFPRSAGAALVLLAAAAAVVVWALSAAWYAPAPGQPEGRFRVLRAGGGTMVVEYVPTVGSEELRGRIFTLSGGAFAVEADVVRVSDYLFFVGAEELFRLRAVHSESIEGAAAAAREPFPRPEELLADWFTGQLRRLGARIPGVQLQTIRSRLVQPRPLEQYLLEIAYPSVELVWDKSLREVTGRDDTISKHDDHPLSGR